MLATWATIFPQKWIHQGKHVNPRRKHPPPKPAAGTAGFGRFVRPVRNFLGNPLYFMPYNEIFLHICDGKSIFLFRASGAAKKNGCFCRRTVGIWEELAFSPKMLPRTLFRWESAHFASFCDVLQGFVMKKGSKWPKYGSTPGTGRQIFAKSEKMCLFGLAGLFGRYGGFWRPVWGGCI